MCIRDRYKTAAKALISQMSGVPTASHPGTLAPRASLLTVDAAHSVLSSVRIDAQGALTLRLYCLLYTSKC